MRFMSRVARGRTQLGAFLIAFCLGSLPAPASRSIGPMRPLTPSQQALVRLTLTSVGSPFPEIERLRVASDTASKEAILRTRYVGRDGKEVTAYQIATFLDRFGSPMTPHAGEIVRAANRYGVDPKLIVAIAGVESTFGRRCRGYNAWGWNGGRTRWSSWSESINEYTRLLSENYPNSHNIRRVAPTYNPNTPDAWRKKVGYLMATIESSNLTNEA